MTMKHRTSMAGLSLVELMVALVISLVLMLGVVQVFIASQTASRLSEGPPASGKMHDSRWTSWAGHQMAGHMGCVNDQAHVVKNQETRYRISVRPPAMAVRWISVFPSVASTLPTRLPVAVWRWARTGRRPRACRLRSPD